MLSDKKLNKRSISEKNRIDFISFFFFGNTKHDKYVRILYIKDTPIHIDFKKPQLNHIFIEQI